MENFLTWYLAELTGQSMTGEYVPETNPLDVIARAGQ